MGEEFEDRDLSESVFWGVNLQRTMFRDADLSGATFFHTMWNDVTVDGEVHGLVVNGVDVTDFVHAHDRWYPLRYQLSPSTGDGIRSAWATLSAEWAQLLERVSRSDAGLAAASVNGEWSLRDTLRHLLFAMDKWFTWPLLGDRTFAPLGLPNTGSQGGDWPGLDMSLQPDLGEVLHAWAAQRERFDRFIAGLEVDSLPDTVEVLENGTVPGVMCFHVVLEEEFEHLRYALRDLATLGLAED
ncbi:MAG: DinB family protein [Ilumatobacteraceae bacterium]